MPIRFRCPTCNGLMSIARRKANAEVACPKCGEQVIVPATEPAAVAANGAAGADRPLFERPDFERLLTPAEVTPVKLAEPVAVPVAVPADEPAVVVLSYPAAAMLAAGGLGLVALSFAAGYLLK